MNVGDLVDDGLDNIGIIVDYGWFFPESGGKTPAYRVHFLTAPQHNGWYDDNDLKLVDHCPTEEVCK